MMWPIDAAQESAGKLTWLEMGRAILSEVGLTRDDVLDIGRDWIIGPPGMEMEVAPPRPRACVYSRNRDNPLSRTKPLIAITGSIDSEEMLHLLAHECGHIACNAWTSEPDYEREYRAECWATARVAHHLGRPVKLEIIEAGKRYVRAHCEVRFRIMGADPIKGWWQEAVEWCGFVAPEPLTFR